MLLSRFFLVPMLLLAPFATRGDDFAAYETPPLLDAYDQLGEAEAVGDQFVIERQVPNDGQMNRYVLTSNYQRIEACGNSMLLERAREQEAIAVLRELKLTKGYLDAVKAAAAGPLGFAKDALADPVGVAKDVPQSVTNWWNDLSIASMSTGDENEPEKSQTERVKAALGYGRVKRRLAAEMGVDPFSSNEILQTELDEVAWSSFVGGLAVDLAMSQAPMAAKLAVATSRQIHGVRALGWNIPPQTLEAGSAVALKKMGLWSDEISAINDHPVCTLTHTTLLVSALASIESVPGRGGLAKQAARADDETSCRFYVELAELVWLYHRSAKPVVAVSATGDTLTFDDADGRSVLPVRADYLAWTAETDLLFAALPPTGDRLVWLSGVASPSTRQVLLDRGIALHERVFAERTEVLDVVSVLVPDRAKLPDDDPTNETREMLNDMSERTAGWIHSLDNRLLGREELPPVGAEE